MIFFQYFLFIQEENWEIISIRKTLEQINQRKLLIPSQAFRGQIYIDWSPIKQYVFDNKSFSVKTVLRRDEIEKIERWEKGRGKMRKFIEPNWPFIFHQLLLLLYAQIFRALSQRGKLKLTPRSEKEI